MSENLCDTCTGACCRARTGMTLSSEEAKFLKDGGTKLRGLIVQLIPEIDPEDDYDGFYDELVEDLSLQPEFWRSRPEFKVLAEIILRPNRERLEYVLQTDCGYLDTSVEPPMCIAHEDPLRPKICQEFEAGSLGCLQIRQKSGISNPIEIRRKPA